MQQDGAFPGKTQVSPCALLTIKDKVNITFSACTTFFLAGKHELAHRGTRGFGFEKLITAHDGNGQIEFKLNRIFVNENK